MLDKINFNDAGLVPAIAQDVVTGDVLMLAWMNEESISKRKERFIGLDHGRNYGAKVIRRGTYRNLFPHHLIAMETQFYSKLSKRVQLAIQDQKHAFLEI